MRVEAQPVDGESFQFIATLAKELSTGNVSLPAIPDIAARVLTALDDETVTTDKLERIVSSEPVLAARIVQLANSAALNFTGRRVSELRTAIARVGFGMVRTTSMAYALAQLRRSKLFETIQQPLSVLWNRCTLVAAMSRVAAVRISRVNPDTAMFAGLLHGVGELYILARASEHSELLAADAAYRQVVSDWNKRLAQEILESWEIDEQVTAAIAGFQEFERSHDGPVDLTDVLTVGYLLSAYMNHPESLELNMADVAICRRLGLNRADYEALIESSREEISALREALDYS